MEDTDLIRAGHQTINEELARGVGDDGRLGALNDDIRADEITSIQAIHDDADDGRPGRLCRSWGSRTFLLGENRRGREDELNEGVLNYESRIMLHSRFV